MVEVSVVMPTFNSESTIMQCIKSIQHSMERDKVSYEIIVVDNGSTDKTKDILSKLNVKVVTRPELRVSGLRNFGVKMATGQYIAFIDSDCTIVDGWFLRGRLLLQKDKVGVVGCDYSCIAPTWVERAWFRDEYPLCTPVRWLPAGNVLLTRNLFLDVDGFREDIETAEDWDLCKRILLEGYDVVSDGEMKCFHLGNPKDLKTFFRKEKWYGKGAAQLFFEHKFFGPIQALTIFHTVFTSLFVMNIFLCLSGRGPSSLIFSGGLFLPLVTTTFMAIWRAFCNKNILSAAPLMLLYFAYFSARSLAMLEYLFGRLPLVGLSRARL